jgi:formyltetrahydrofolate-dependent phosphoribosylglycinamide formyltransferase
MSANRKRLAVLASGGGSNLQALLDHLESLGAARAADVVLVASEREQAGALARAARHSVATALLPIAGHEDRPSLAALLDEHDIDLVVLAGYVRFVPDDVVHAFAERIVNVHPALLPAFGGQGMYGRRVHEAVLAAGVGVTGVTVHMVDTVYDHGRILAQWPVPVLGGDDASGLAARVLRVEHALYPRVVNALAAGQLDAAAPLTHIKTAEPSFLMQPGLAGFTESMNRALGHIDEF